MILSKEEFVDQFKIVILKAISDKGLTQEDVADGCSKKRQSINRMINQPDYNPGIYTAYVVLDALDYEIVFQPKAKTVEQDNT